MREIICGNVSTWKPQPGVTAIYCGRPNAKYRLTQKGSPLANPFVLGRDGDRDAVIEKYRHWLWQEIQRAKAENTVNRAFDELHRICQLLADDQQVALLCWCEPQPCHVRVVARALRWMMQN